MTKTTEPRQFRLLIDGVLKVYDIDNLKLTVDLCSAVEKFQKSETPVRAREEIVNGIRHALGKAMEQQTFDEIIEHQFIRFPLNWTAFPESEKDTFRRFLKREENTLEQFVNWWTRDEWRLAHPPQTLGKIMTMWPQAFFKAHAVSTSERL